MATTLNNQTVTALTNTTESNPVKDWYVTGKKVQFFPNDTHKKFGRILNVDEYGFTYIVEESSDSNAVGTFFRSHSLGLSFKVVEE